VVSSLVGIAIAQGKIESLETPIASFFPNLLGDSADPARRAITIEDLVSMRAGLESTSGRNYGRWVHSGNWVKHILSRPLEADPGGPMIYSTGTTHLLSAILTKATGASTRDFAQEVLAGPLGFDLAPWPRDPQGIYFGGNDMVLTPRQMLAFGEMYLHHGRANGKQIVPESWVEASWVPRTRSRRSGRMYGYGWWMRELGGVWAYYAWGFGGQFIFVVPKLETVVVTTSADTPGEGRRGHLGEVYDLVGKLILEPIATGGEVLPLEHKAD
jgi:CubicO group peptidase (beta-lactamase class C family)